MPVCPVISVHIALQPVLHEWEPVAAIVALSPDAGELRVHCRRYASAMIGPKAAACRKATCAFPGDPQELHAVPDASLSNLQTSALQHWVQRNP